MRSPGLNCYQHVPSALSRPCVRICLTGNLPGSFFLSSVPIIHQFKSIILLCTRTSPAWMCIQTAPSAVAQCSHTLLQSEQFQFPHLLTLFVRQQEQRHKSNRNQQKYRDDHCPVKIQGFFVTVCKICVKSIQSQAPLCICSVRQALSFQQSCHNIDGFPFFTRLFQHHIKDLHLFLIIALRLNHQYHCRQRHCNKYQCRLYKRFLIIISYLVFHFPS